MKKKLTALVTLAVLGLPTVGSAAAITWGAAQAITGDTDVSINGTLVNAWNFGSAAATTVNGVNFQPVLIGAPQTVSQNFGPHALSINAERVEHTLTNFGTGSALPATPFSGLSSVYRALLEASAGSNFGDRTNNLQLGGLTVGNSYQFQAWFNDSGTDGQFAYPLFISDLLNNGVTLQPSLQQDGQGLYTLGGTGQWVIGTFTADAPSQSLRFVRGEVGGGINGFQLRNLSTTIPVSLPGTLPLSALALLAAVVAVQRRR